MTIVWRALALLFVALTFAMPAAADPAADTVAAFNAEQKGDFATAVKLYSSAAKAGNAYAQSSLGSLYYKGQGVPKDLAQATDWFRKAAAQGDAAGQFGLGGIYERGEGMKKPDAAEAIRLYKLSAAQGYALAQSTLAISYATGVGVPMDMVQAHMWFSLAANGGDETAKRRRDSLAAKMTPAQLAQAEKMAKDFKPTPPPEKK